jgi:hypothetical protein
VIVRAIGPELSQQGVPNFLADPTLELNDSIGALIASNNDWQHTILGGIITQDQVRDIRSSGHAPGTRANLRSSQTSDRVATQPSCAV